MSGSPGFAAQRLAAGLALMRAGVGLARAARSASCAGARLRTAAVAEGIPIPPRGAPRGHRPSSVRDSASRRAATEYMDGAGSMQQCGDRHGVCRQAVHWALKLIRSASETVASATEQG